MDTLGKLQLQRHNTDRLFCEKSYGGLRESLTSQNALHELMWGEFHARSKPDPETLEVILPRQG